MTTTPDLKAAALAALARSEEIGEDDWYLASDFSIPDTDALFIATASPEAVYALIKRLQVAEYAAKDKDRLDFVLENDVFLNRVMADSGSMTYQLMTQDDDENYISLSGQDRFYPSSRAAIDAVIAARRLTS